MVFSLADSLEWYSIEKAEKCMMSGVGCTYSIERLSFDDSPSD